MAETRAQTELTPEIWDNDFSTEFFQRNPFSQYSGTGTNNPIVMKEDFASRRGNGITFEFITNFKRGVILNRQPLRGHEDKLGEFGDKVYWNLRKKGVSIHEYDQDHAAIDLRGAARATLKTWADEDVKWEVLDRLGDVGAGCDIPYATSSLAQKNAWLTNNPDRILFGAARSNLSSGNWTTSIGNVDATADKLTKDALSLLKRMALTASPRITPIEVSSKNRRMFVAIAHPFVFRDFKKDTEAVRAAVSVVERNESIFLGGDLIYDNVVLHEVDDMPVYVDAGAAATDVSPVYLLGQEALGWAIKQRYRTREQEDDYGQVEGIGMLGKWGMKKLTYGLSDVSETGVTGKQRGVATGFFSAEGD
jgi:Protein of unknown function (DUF4043)